MSTCTGINSPLQMPHYTCVMTLPIIRYVRVIVRDMTGKRNYWLFCEIFCESRANYNTGTQTKELLLFLSHIHNVQWVHHLQEHLDERAVAGGGFTEGRCGCDSGSTVSFAVEKWCVPGLMWANPFCKSSYCLFRKSSLVSLLSSIFRHLSFVQALLFALL